MKILNLLAVLFLAIFMFSGCDKNDPQERESDKTLSPDPEDAAMVDFVPKWDDIINQESPTADDVFIGSKYAGIQNRTSIANPPYIYVGAVFPKSTFSNSFDKENTESKHPIDLTFNFPTPYIRRMETPRGTRYLQLLKEALKSDEYKSFVYPSKPFSVRLAELKSFSTIERCFPENKDFGHGLTQIVKQEFTAKNVKSLSIGEIVFKGFTVSMDTPAQGLFINAPSDLQDLVYIRTLTYGTVAYFVIASDHPYRDVLTAFKTSFVDAYEKPKGALNQSQIVLLTISDVNQEATIKETFEDLKTFVANPFNNKHSYGYPVFCKGFYAKDNAALKRESKNISLNHY